MVVIITTSVGAVLVLFNYTTVLNGWDLGAMLVLLGCFYLVQGFGELVLQPSFEKFMEHVRLGTLDFALLKPASAQFLVTLRHFQVVQLAQMGFGGELDDLEVPQDRKSTRLNSSHVRISYAVFCLKKKNT